MSMTRSVLLAAGLTAAGFLSPALAQEVTVIDLTQTGCQFLESEDGQDLGYQPAAKADCEAINAQTADERLAAHAPMHLAPGKYIFRVTNQDVPYMLGFYLRGAGLIDKTLLPSVSGGGLHEGITQDYEITLEPGEYVYSCPLNTTPDYRLIVE